jgi:hypothetical protein
VFLPRELLVNHLIRYSILDISANSLCMKEIYVPLKHLNVLLPDAKAYGGSDDAMW